MKLISVKSIFSLVAFSFLAMVATAQFDDLYYDPSEGDGSILESDYNSSEDTYAYDEVDDNDSEYDSDYYDDYTYTRRINRFRKNSNGSNYYSSVFYNDPFYNPSYQSGNSITISVGNGWGSHTRMNRYNSWDRANSWNRWDNWGYNGTNGWIYQNVWGNPCGLNNGYVYGLPDYRYYGGYYSGYSGINNYYGNNYFGNSYYNNKNVGNSTTGHYGSRKNGSVGSSTNGRDNTPRRIAPTKDPETGAISSTTYSGDTRTTNGVRNKKGDEKALQVENKRNSSENRNNTGTSTRSSTRNNSGVSSQRSNGASTTRSSTTRSSNRSSTKKTSRSSSSKSTKRGGGL